MIKLLNLAKHFESFVKKADLKQDMAKRMLLGLSQHLGIQGQGIIEDEHGTKKQIDILALRELIPGAKNLLKYGVQLCINECENFDVKYGQNYEEDESDYSLNPAVYNLNYHFDKNNLFSYKEILYKLIDIFKSDKWAPQYGGEPWQKIAESLMNILNSLLKAQNAKQNNDLNKEGNALLEMITEINIFEGLQHNSSGIFPDLYNEEGRQINMSRDYKDVKNLERLMSVKELEDPDDILSEIMPVISPGKNKQVSGLSNYINSAKQKELSQNKEKIDQEIQFINDNREIKEFIKIIINCKNELEKINNEIDKNKEFIISEFKNFEKKIYYTESKIANFKFIFYTRRLDKRNKPVLDFDFNKISKVYKIFNDSVIFNNYIIENYTTKNYNFNKNIDISKIKMNDCINELELFINDLTQYLSNRKFVYKNKINNNLELDNDEV